jgi:dimethylargininase
VDGGDVCEADGHFFVGVSARTNESGAKQLRTHLEAMGYSASLVDIRHSRNLLHLKTGIAYIGDGVWVLAPGIARDVPALAGIDPVRRIEVSADESYAANCIRVNDDVLLPADHPRMLEELEHRGFRAVPLDMSEFRKMDGGLSCLSLRFQAAWPHGSGV